MNLSQRLAEMSTLIKTGAPALAADVNAAALVVTELAPVIATAAPGTGVANVANDVNVAAQAAQSMANAIASTVAGAANPVTVSDPDSEAVAASSAANVSAQATATAAAHESRIQMLEMSLVELLPAVATLLQKFGL